MLRAEKGAYVYLRDVAQVLDGFEEEKRITEINSSRGMMMMVQKRSGANTVAVARETTRELERLKPNLPRDIELHLVADTSTDIVNSINNVSNAVKWAFVFVVLVALLFLRNLRSALIIAMTIPFSLIMAFIFMWTMGWTINIISMSSLAVAMGMVVDNAVVVLENITKKVEAGAAPREAAMFGSEEVGTAVSASTLTTIVVFVPLIFLEGESGVMFKQLGGLLTATLVASMVCALWLDPDAGRWLLQTPGTSRRGWARAWPPSMPAPTADLKPWMPLMAVSCAGPCARGEAVCGVGHGAAGRRRPGLPDGRVGICRKMISDRLTIEVELDIGTRVEETAEVCRRVIPVALAAAGPGNVKTYSIRCGESRGMDTSSNTPHRPGADAPGGDPRAREEFQDHRSPRRRTRWRAGRKWSRLPLQRGRGREQGAKPIIIEVTGFDFDILQGIAESCRHRPRHARRGGGEHRPGHGPAELHVEIDRVKGGASERVADCPGIAHPVLRHGGHQIHENGSTTFCCALTNPSGFAGRSCARRTYRRRRRIRLDSVAEIVDAPVR